MKLLLPALMLATFASAALADDGLSLTSGVEYSSGTYGNAESTTILYVPVTANYVSGDLTLKLTVPYIRVSGPGGVIRGFGKVPSSMQTSFGRMPGGGTTTNTYSGLGDIIGQAGYTVYSGDALRLDAVGKIKFGTADANKGLGTGENDYFAQLDGYYALGGGTTLLATGGYEIVGAPAGITTNNVLYGMLGADQRVSDRSKVGIMYRFMQSPALGVPGQRTATLYLRQALSPTLELQVYGLRGFTDSSPDYGGGLLITGAL